MAGTLSDLQIEVLRTLWEHGEGTVADVQQRLKPHRDLATTTVATLLARLVRRGAVARRRGDGRTYLYRAAVEEDEVRRSMVGALMDRLFAGDPAALVHHLVEDQDLDEATRKRLLARLRRESEGGA
ncbi:MAG: BlaI/MecI/CopY family transcriptional regulator [Planctomycetota bacterium]